MPKKKKKKKKTKKTQTKTTERTDDDEATEDKSSSLKAVTKSQTPKKGTTTTTTTTSSTSLLLSKIVGKHARVCDVALKRGNFTSSVKALATVLTVLADGIGGALTDHASSSSSPLSSRGSANAVSQLLEKVMTACQRAKANTAAKKLLEKWKRLSRVTQSDCTNNHHQRNKFGETTTTTTTTTCCVPLTNACLRCAYFCFCMTKDANAAVEVLLIENGDIEKTIEKIGAENLVRGCSFARRKNGGDNGGGGGNTGKKDEEEEKENELLWRVLKLIADVGKGRKYEKNANNERKREMIAKMVSDGGGNDDGHKKVRVDIRTRVELPAPEDEDEMSNTNTTNLRFTVCCEDDGRRRPANRLPLKLFRPISPNSLMLAPACVRAPRVRRVDLSRTVGPGIFALTSVFTKAECQLFIQSALACGLVKDDATDEESMEYCEICMYNSVVENIWQRIRDHFPADDEDTAAIATTSETKEGGNDDDNKNVVYHWLPVGINPRFRIFKYDDKSVYRRHLDGAWPCGALDERTNEFIVDTNALRLKNTANGENHHRATRLTFLIYLTDTFRGGETTFYSVDDAGQDHEKVIVGRAVSPRVGSVLCFPHGDAEHSPVHEGSRVFAETPPAGDAIDHRGGIDDPRLCKFVVRTDVVFEKKPRRRRCC